MKKIILSITLLFATVTLACAQQPQAGVVTRNRLDQNTVIKDSVGNVIPYATWLPMLQSGDYTLKSKYLLKDGFPDRSVEPERTLVHSTPEQKANYLAKVADMKQAAAAQQEARMLAFKPKESEFFTTGEAIRPFKVHPMDGKKIETKDWAGKTVVLNFWFIGCPPCRAEIPDLNKLQAKYADNPNVIFIAIALDQEYDIKDFIKKSPYNYHLVGDGQYYANLFKIHLFPTNVVIDKQGKVRFHSSGGGGTTPYWLDKTIAESEKGAM